MTHKLTYSRCPFESKDPFSSLTIKFWIDEFEKYYEYLNKTLDLSQNLFDVTIPTLQGQILVLAEPEPMDSENKTSRILQDYEGPQIIKRLGFRRNSFVMDLNFTKTIEEESTLTVTSNKRDAMVRNLTNPNTFSFERTFETLP